MNDLTTTPTADLIAEWGNKENVYVDEEDYRDEIGEPIENAAQLYADADAALDAHWIAIATELDRRCMDAGIAMIEGQFHYARKWFSVVLEDGEYLLREVLCAEYSHQYRTWLLLKEGGNNAR